MLGESRFVQLILNNWHDAGRLWLWLYIFHINVVCDSFMLQNLHVGWLTWELFRLVNQLGNLNMKQLTLHKWVQFVLLISRVLIILLARFGSLLTFFLYFVLSIPPLHLISIPFLTFMFYFIHIIFSVKIYFHALFAEFHLQVN